jgi:putative hydrolase of the HAD superfamily
MDSKMTARPEYRLLTIDLDDTLWPCAPTLQKAEVELFAWLERFAPKLTVACDQEGMRRHRRELMAGRPRIAHDITAVRLRSLRDLLSDHGYDAGLADEAMALFLEHRNRVEPYDDVIPVLRALRGKHRLVSLTNGNADVSCTPLRGLFDCSLSAADVGAQKPDPALFLGALKWGGVPPEQALHLGDDPHLDVQAARSLGMQAVWVNRSGRSWPGELDPPQAEVRNLAELQRWLGAVERAL